MKDFTLAEIAKACNGEYVGDESLKNTKITSVERDSRQVNNGSLFLAIKGERVDGHDFIEKCFAQGAVCALCEKAPENATKPCIVVSSTLDAVKKIGRAYREKFDIPVIGISGSVGKPLQKKCYMPFFHRGSRPTKHKAISITSSVFRSHFFQCPRIPRRLLSKWVFPISVK